MSVSQLFRTSALLGIFFSFFACMPEPNNGENSKKGEKLKVLVTTSIIQEAVQKILKDSADVELIIPIGADPHSYQFSPEDAIKSHNADIIIANGLHLEHRMRGLFQNTTRSKTLIYMADGVPISKLRHLDNKEIDPHIWLNVQLWKSCVSYMASRLEKDTEWTNYIQKNLDEYLIQLEHIDITAKRRLKRIPEESKYLITSHDAFGYFGNAYGIKVLGIKGLSTTGEASIKHVDSLVSLITEKKIKTIFPEFSTSTKDIKTLVEQCQENGIEIKLGQELYSISMKGPTNTYDSLILHNVNSIVKGLR